MCVCVYFHVCRGVYACAGAHVCVCICGHMYMGASSDIRGTIVCLLLPPP